MPSGICHNTQLPVGVILRLPIVSGQSGHNTLNEYVILLLLSITSTISPLINTFFSLSITVFVYSTYNVNGSSCVAISNINNFASIFDVCPLNNTLFCILLELIDNPSNGLILSIAT